MLLKCVQLSTPTSTSSIVAIIVIIRRRQSCKGGLKTYVQFNEINWQFSGSDGEHECFLLLRLKSVSPRRSTNFAIELVAIERVKCRLGRQGQSLLHCSTFQVSNCHAVQSTAEEASLFESSRIREKEKREIRK